MTILRILALLLALGSMLAPPTLAQMPGDPRPRYSHALTGAAPHTFQRGGRVERVDCATSSASDGAAPVTRRESRASKGVKSSLKSPLDATR